MECFTLLWQAISQSDPHRKGELVEQLYTLFLQKRLTFAHDGPIKPLESPSYATITTIVPPKKVLKRKRFDDPEGQAVLLHAIAHIEYSAIDLALDSAYRFRDMPQAYYFDWIEVAHDEVRHFRMLEALMKELGLSYGNFPVHTALFDAGKKSSNDLLERMAVVPRYLEAGGLDANPRIIAKLKQIQGNFFVKKMITTLEMILKEEIDHVAKGDRWFKSLCDERGLSYEYYFEIIERYYPGLAEKNLSLNIEARRQAGFACDELKRMGAKVCD